MMVLWVLISNLSQYVKMGLDKVCFKKNVHGHVTLFILFLRLGETLEMNICFVVPFHSFFFILF